MFISRFKYKIEKAKIIKIIYCNEHVIREKEYEKEIEKLEKLRDKHTEATKHLEFLKMNGC